MARDETYIGDGVYVRFDGLHVVLRTTDAMGFDNVIYLDDDVQQSLIEYIQRLRKGDDDDRGPN